MAGGLMTVTAPAASAVPIGFGSCSGALVLAKISPGLVDTPQNETITTSLLKNTITKSPIGGTCTGMLESPQDTALNGPPPATVEVGAVATKLVGATSCQSGEPGGYPQTGKQTISSVPSQVTALGKKWQIQAYITLEGYDPSALDVVDVTGLVSKGLSIGAVETATYWENPVVKGTDPEGDGKNNPTADGANHSDDDIFNAGYSVDDNYALSVLVRCLSGTAEGEVSQSDAITQVALGGGGATSPDPLLGGTANGATFASGN
jgi:hypothetical protein